MRDKSATIREGLRSILVFIGAIWAVFLLSLALPALTAHGVVPRTLIGLVGVPAMPFLHANWQHLLSNTVPLFVLLSLLAGSRANSWVVVITVALAGGILLWCFGRPAVHIGASGLVFGLAVFLIVAGLRERRFVSLVVAVMVGLLYGGTLLWGVLPQFGSQVSWDGHLFGAVAGGLVAVGFVRSPRAAQTS